MSDGIIQIPPDSNGKKLRTFEQTVGSNTVQQQAVTITDSTGQTVEADGSGRMMVVLHDGFDIGTGLLSSAVYTDTTGAANSPVIGLLKGLFVKLSGILTFKRALGTTTVGGFTVTTTSTQVIASNASRKALLIINNSTQIVYVNAGTATAANTSIAIQPNGGTFQTETSSSAFQAFVVSSTASITIVEDA